MISNLFAQFRHRHASGSLTSELLMAHAEQYLVKATVSIDAQVVGTALAADKDLAAADDRAKERVLAMLGFGPDGTGQTNGSAAPVARVPAGAPQPQTVTPVVPKPIAKEAAAPAIAPDPSPEPADPAHGATEDDDMGRPLDSFTPEEAPAPSEVPASSLAANAIENFDDTHPVDLSDIIAQTDVEMSRLGWSSVQGRTYLEQTFNKRSRQQLSDEELLTFLLYLESQSTPSMG
ncbi:hypothetical protein [Leptothoe kymatousa]|uniref:Uncharacterized protein n=1 Tax=Leptothoe kymatousa TAU-MAC 1615 TaxID=2364775 RepID=A0ABS5Y545_9CYAN|nr:hypothetical protein [Leptothoe kymatousa TAU-MAC 1615]